MARPPALRSPSSVVWQPAQLPRAATCCPRANMLALKGEVSSGPTCGKLLRQPSKAALTVNTPKPKEASCPQRRRHTEATLG